jgi:hypothetical protein
MYHNALEHDLKTIFGMPKVLFGSPAFGKEQDVLFCEEETSKTKAKQGSATARVAGKISVIGLIGKNKSGYFTKQIQLADVKLTQRFVFSREEEQIKMTTLEERFNVYSLDFLYFYKEQYNPPAGKIMFVDGWFVNIINTVRRAIYGYTS